MEGNHHVIKSYPYVGTLHLLMLTKQLGLMLANQHVELNAAIEKQRVHKAHRFGHSFFKDLIYKVFDFILDKLLQQLKHAEKGGHEEQPCSTQFMKSWGLPYHHYIRGYLETKISILLQDIPKQWLLDRNPLILPSVNVATLPHELASPRSLFM